MAMENLHRIYFSFIHDADRKSSEEAGQILSRAKDTYLDLLHEAGKAIGKVVRSGAEPSTLDDSVERMKELPLLDYWKEFIEISGQVVIGKALALERGKKRAELLAQGLRIMSVATFGAFPLSDYSQEMVKKAKAAEQSVAEAADAIIMSGAGLESWNPARRRTALQTLAAKKTGKLGG